jgi:hypothetical protein
MNPLAAAALAAGELVCDFGAARGEVLIYEALTEGSAQVLSLARPGRKPVQVRITPGHVHLIEPERSSVRVTTLTACTRTRTRAGALQCTQFAARHAWHFDTSALIDADASFRRQPSGASYGVCEPWNLD